MDLGLRGKVALVAAASRGLGRAVAEELAAEGCSLAICSRDAGSIGGAGRRVAAESGVAVLALAADVAQEKDIAGFVSAAQEHFGRVDVLVTNTGGPPSGPFDAHDVATWRAATESLLFAPLEFAR